MIFKNKRVETLWQFVNPNLQNQAMYFNLYAQNEYGRELVITDSVRLLSEQKKILEDNPNYKGPYPGPHPYGNAFDVSTRDSTGKQWSKAEIVDLVAWFNQEFPYGDPKKKSAIFHNVAGEHIHCQISHITDGIGINQNDPSQLQRLMAAIRGLE